jgi:hypothetical protein
VSVCPKLQQHIVKLLSSGPPLKSLSVATQTSNGPLTHTPPVLVDWISQGIGLALLLARGQYMYSGLPGGARSCLSSDARQHFSSVNFVCKAMRKFNFVRKAMPKIQTRMQGYAKNSNSYARLCGKFKLVCKAMRKIQTRMQDYAGNSYSYARLTYFICSSLLPLIVSAQS